MSPAVSIRLEDARRALSVLELLPAPEAEESAKVIAEAIEAQELDELAARLGPELAQLERDDPEVGNAARQLDWEIDRIRRAQRRTLLEILAEDLPPALAAGTVEGDAVSLDLTRVADELLARLHHRHYAIVPTQ